MSTRMGGRTESGGALLVAMVCVVIGAGMGAALLTISVYQNRSAARAADRDMAFHTAEAGVDDAIYRLNVIARLTWQGTKTKTLELFNVVDPQAGGDVVTVDPPSPAPDPGSTNPVQMSLLPQARTSFSTTGAEPSGNEGSVALLDDATAEGLGITSDSEVHALLQQIVSVGMDGSVTTRNEIAPKAVNGGSYRVTIVPAFGDPTGTYTITSVGLHGEGTRAITVVLNSLVPSGSNTSRFSLGDFGLFSNEITQGSSANIFVDSYKPSEGWNPDQQADVTYLDKDGSTVSKTVYYDNANGHVGSNSGLGYLSGTFFGMGVSQEGTSIVNGPYYAGGTDNQNSYLDLPPVTYAPPAGLETASSWPKADKTGGITLDAFGGVGGSFRFSTLDLGSKENLIVTGGDVTLYVDGDIKMNAQATLKIAEGSTLTIFQKSGSITLNGQFESLPAGKTLTPGALQGKDLSSSNWRIFSATVSTPEKPYEAKFNGGSVAAVQLYAPQMNFKQNGGADLFGWVVAQRVHIDGTMSFHRDEEAGQGIESTVVQSSEPPKFGVVAWNERHP